MHCSRCRHPSRDRWTLSSYPVLSTCHDLVFSIASGKNPWRHLGRCSDRELFTRNLMPSSSHSWRVLVRQRSASTLTDLLSKNIKNCILCSAAFESFFSFSKTFFVPKRERKNRGPLIFFSLTPLAPRAIRKSVCDREVFCLSQASMRGRGVGAPRESKHSGREQPTLQMLESDAERGVGRT